MIRQYIHGVALLASIGLANMGILSAQGLISNHSKPRIVVTTDPELDDLNSLIRFLLYSSDFNIEGLVYASSGFHWKGDGKGTLFSVPNREYNRFGLQLCPCTSWRWNPKERFIHDAVAAYAASYPNLKKHHPDYPSPALLQSKIKVGNIYFDGDISEDTPGSDLIKTAILDDQPGPLFLAAWGGMSTIARALKSIQLDSQHTTAWPNLQQRISQKVILLPSGDQDDTYKNYIAPNWPGILYRQFTRNADFGYTAPLNATEATRYYLSAPWLKNHVLSSGPLGKLYRVWGDGKQMVPGDIMDYFGIKGLSEAELKAQGFIVWLPPQAPGSWISEGDTPTFLNLIDNGLQAWSFPETGGWGGMQNGPIVQFLDGADTSAQAFTDALSNTQNTHSLPPGTLDLATLFPEIQNDFAARMKWAATNIFANANHAPILQHLTPIFQKGTPGASLLLKAKGTDPDGHVLSYDWHVLPTINSNASLTMVSTASKDAVKVTVPKDATAGHVFHVALRAKDSGSPAMVRYLHYVIEVSAP